MKQNKAGGNRRTIFRLLSSILYIGLLVPGWIIASKYQPPIREDISSADVTATATRMRLSDTWTAPGLVGWSQITELAIPEQAPHSLEVGQSLTSGKVIAADRYNPTFAISCDVEPIETYPTELGGDFLACLHSMLAANGLPVSGDEKLSRTLGTSTQEALEKFYIRNRSIAPEVEEPWKSKDKAEFLNGRISFYNQDPATYAVLLRSAETELEKLLAETGPYLNPSHWLTIPASSSMVIDEIDQDSGRVILGSGSLVVKVDLPNEVVNAAGRKWTLPSGSEILELSVSEPRTNAETGLSEVTVELAMPSETSYLSGDLVDITLVANDTGKEVLSVPGGAVTENGETHHITVVNPSGEAKTIELADMTKISGRVVLPSGVGLNAGDKVKLG